MEIKGCTAHSRDNKPLKIVKSVTCDEGNVER